MNRLLATAMPALTLPTGANTVEIFKDNNKNFDMPIQFKNDQNDWPSNRIPKDWHHSDIKEVAYTYIYNLFDKFVSLGGLNQ